ncbi:MAG: hypothetical protein Q9207_008523 [Kuettlingeria erythrocarpa]
MTTTHRYSTSLSYRPRSSQGQDHQDTQSTADKMNPSSELLQDLLREKKASQHARRMSQQSGYAASERQIQSSPIGPPGARQVSNPSNRRTSGYTAPKEMGLREMEEYISKINKQNFDLKLEVFHRRQRSEALEARAEKAEELQVQYDELQQINEDLLLELGKRDVAVEEAVALICDLEARIDQLETEQAKHTTSHKIAIDSSNARVPEPPATPSPLHGTFISPASSPNGGQQKQPNNSLLRSPSFLTDNHPSTSALRGLFTKDGISTDSRTAMAKPSIWSLRRPGSVFSQDDEHETVDGDPFSVNPRRLSLLSESSFVSVYGKEKEKITPSSAHRNPTLASLTHDDDMSFSRSLSPQEGRIRSWIENRDHPASPSKKPVPSIRNETFSSIGELLEPNEPISRDVRPAVSPTPSKKYRPQPQSQQPGRTDTKTSFGGPIFGPDILPPTPGTMSTATLGGRSSNHSIVAERSLGGTPQRSSGSTALPDHQFQERTYATRSFRNGAAEGASRGMDDDDTDIEISDDEGRVMAAASSLRDAFNDAPNSQTIQRPELSTHATNLMFTGEGHDAVRPARFISYPSPSKSQQSASQASTKSTGKASASSKNSSQTQTGERHLSSQKGTPYFHNALRRKKAFS